MDMIWQIAASVLRAVPWWIWLLLIALPLLKRLAPRIRKVFFG